MSGIFGYSREAVRVKVRVSQSFEISNYSVIKYLYLEV